ncbi:hypothetical protein F9U64_20930 [Gracilibacillus oryzae]|uniref:Uncharacterized protein n=1 Tax=Gracilibacillus oryzae TaxID=1672701 RepID=A0A7C8GR46_9BACI|nr:hypothetical protein [Gracilibacillus oryzae]KAB8126001.1 hypothetical protein F9U64_20930 [Gracilibacillus oryzae]
MKKYCFLLVSFLSVILIIGCNSEKDAIEYLTDDQEYKKKLVVFYHMSLEESYRSKVLDNQYKINNDKLEGSPLISIRFIDVSDKEMYDYNFTKSLDLEDYPVLLLFDEEEEIFRTTDPDKLYEYFNSISDE